jgi:uncharacterized protein YbjT (DUF2867 family)
MKVLLTGGTGYVGRALRRELAERGHEVRLLVRGGGGRDRGPGSFEVVYGDVLDPNACLRACEGCDAVVHLVGIIREFPRSGITFEEMHTTATRTIVRSAERKGVARFIHMSALGSHENAASAYHQTKYSAEQVVCGSSLAWTIFRPSVIFDRGDEFTGMLVEMVRRGVVPLIGGGMSKLQPVSRADVVRCMAASLTMPETRGRIFELGGADQLAFKEIQTMIAAHLGLKPRMMPVPAALMKPVVRLMERFPRFPLTSDQLTMLLEDNVCDTREAELMFGFTPASFAAELPLLLAGR